MMIDTELVLQQMRAANPAPSLEHLAADDLDLVRNIVTRERSATTTPPPQARRNRLIPQRTLRPVLAAGLAFILVLGTLGASLLLLRGGDETATGGAACPPGSTPNQPGPADQPRPQLDDGGFTAFDPGTGQAFMLTGDGLWMFDVCTNTWTAAPAPGDIGFVTDFVYDVDSERAISFGIDPDVAEMTRVGSYEPSGQTWTKMNGFVAGPAPEGAFVSPWLKAVYDPVTGLVVVQEPSMSAMWTYDVDTDTWTEIDQGWPRPEVDGESFLTYDASVDRLIVYLPGDSTWEFDIRTGRWEKRATNTPEQQGWGWWPTGEEFVYDEANQVSVFLVDPMTEYDASAHFWKSQSEPVGAWGPYASYRNPTLFSAGWTYDSVNRRILFLGTGWHDTKELERLESETAERDRWRIREMTGGVFACNLATGEWTTLLEPTTE